MVKLKVKLALFNLTSKLVFTSLFLLFMPWITERINLRQVDNDLIQKRESFINLISTVGIEPFISSDATDAFGSFNILKEEFLSLEKADIEEDLNYIEVADRIIDDDEITYRVLNYTFRIDGQMYLLEIGKSLTSIYNARRNISRIIILFLALIIIVTFLTDMQYNHFLLRPLDRITGKLKGISTPSLFDRTPVETSTSDFHHLDQALCELMADIDDLFHREKEITVNISHELLTPVSILRSKLENLLMNDDIEPGISVRVEESLKTLHRLQSLVNSLLFIARIESHQYLREETFSITEILREITAELNPIAEDAGIVIKEEYSGDFEFNDANRSLIFSMLYNVVNNAVKNTPAGGTIILKSIHDLKRYTVLVSDTGKGMTSTQLDNLFMRFKSRTNSDSDGTGIGLAIAKTIADFHNIEVSVNSEPGKGTTFSFLFPENS